MNIQFENVQKNPNVDSSKTNYHIGAEAPRTEAARSYAIDISGAVMDNSAYAGHGRTTEDLMNEAAVTEAALQSEYATVMSHSMSEEDFARLWQEGYSPTDTDVETAVTVVDKIKASLAEAGIVIEGYNDDLDLDVLTQITGNENRARDIVRIFDENDTAVTNETVKAAQDAIEKTQQLREPDDGMIQYLVQNHLKPTIENLYLALYSGSSDGSAQSRGSYYAQDDRGYYAKKAEDISWENIKIQAEGIIKESGQQVSDETLADARFLIEKGIPLTSETLLQVRELKEISFPLKEEAVITAVAQSIAEGGSAGEALLTGKKSLLEQAVVLKQQTAEMTDKAVQRVTDAGEKLTLRNLVRAQENSGQTNPNTDIENPKYLTARRQLEEVRLQMTIAANHSLLKKGYPIDTTELSQLVEALKAEETRMSRSIFQEENAQAAAEDQKLYDDTLQVAREIPALPAAVIGRMITPGAEFTLQHVHESGQALRDTYKAAGDSYEALMTAPRRDLGDSIKKAFQNVDAILEDMELACSEVNRRAVRILGYNQMPMTQENLTAVKNADLALQRVVEQLTPARVLQMIRDDVNPLEQSVTELDEYLTTQKQELIPETEKYSEFLYQLEHSGTITEQERESYIGIYRLLRQVEKSDGAVIGALVNQGAELTISNLLSAVRTSKKAHMDIQVDDSLGALKQTVAEGKSIDAQIQAAYENRLCQDVYDRWVPEDLTQISIRDDMPLEQIWEQLREVSQGSGMQEMAEQSAVQQSLEQQSIERREDQMQRAFLHEKVQEIRECTDSNEETIQALLDGRQPVTFDNLYAAGYLSKHRGTLFRQLFSWEEQEGNLEQAADELHQSMTDKESAKESYQALIEAGEHVLEQRMETAQTTIDLKAVQLFAKQLSLAGAYAREEQYEVPIRVGGELTALRLRIVHDEDSSIFASMETEALGKVAARFDVDTPEKGLEGVIACSSEVAAKQLMQSQEAFRETISREAMPVRQLSIVHSEALQLDTFAAPRGGMVKKVVAVQTVEQETVQQEKIPTSQLYLVAKSLISLLRGIPTEA